MKCELLVNWIKRIQIFENFSSEHEISSPHTPRERQRICSLNLYKTFKSILAPFQRINENQKRLEKNY